MASSTYTPALVGLFVSARRGRYESRPCNALMEARSREQKALKSESEALKVDQKALKSKPKALSVEKKPSFP